MTNENNVSLELAHRLSDVALKAWEDGSMLQRVTPVTAELLNYWFGEARCNERKVNFHEGQRQLSLM